MFIRDVKCVGWVNMVNKNNFLTCITMRYCFFILLILSTAAAAQAPRNDLDQFEYTQEININAPDSVLIQRAKNFFRTPFIVHWDSVAFVNTVHTGKGHINVRVNHWLSGFTVPIDLKLEISIRNNGYRYSIRHLEANKKDSKYIFPLEHKPEGINTAIYEQLLQKSHRYVGSVISMLKRFMQDDM